jgi:seryl-tRNA synthetase
MTIPITNILIGALATITCGLMLMFVRRYLTSRDENERMRVCQEHNRCEDRIKDVEKQMSCAKRQIEGHKTALEERSKRIFAELERGTKQMAKMAAVQEEIKTQLTEWIAIIRDRAGTGDPIFQRNPPT